MQGPKWPLFYSHIDPVWSLLIIRAGCTLGRAPSTKETLPDFREWSRVTQHPRVFRGLMGCQRDPGIGVSHKKSSPINLIVYSQKKKILIKYSYLFEQ